MTPARPSLAEIEEFADRTKRAAMAAKVVDFLRTARSGNRMTINVAYQTANESALLDPLAVDAVADTLDAYIARLLGTAS